MTRTTLLLLLTLLAGCGSWPESEPKVNLLCADGGLPATQLPDGGRVLQLQDECR